MNNPVGTMEELSRKNMEMFQNALRAWSPFTNAMTQAGAKVRQAAGESTVAAAKAMGTDDEKIEQLKKNIAEMEKEINRLEDQA